jgi:hypothetical protein
MQVAEKDILHEMVKIAKKKVCARLLMFSNIIVTFHFNMYTRVRTHGRNFELRFPSNPVTY